MTLFDQPVARWLIYQTVSGNLFYAAIALLLAAATMRIGATWRPMYRWRRLARAFFILGTVALLITLSDLTLHWLLALSFTAVTAVMARGDRRNRAAMALASFALILAACVDAWRYESATWTAPGATPQVMVYADSLGTDFQLKPGENWPTQLGKQIGVPVYNAAVAGATVRTVADLIGQAPPASRTVLLAIGGNDFLSGTTAGDYTHSVNEILTWLREGRNEIIWLEVPAPPTAPWYSWLQRYAAWKNDVTLLPKRLLAATLFDTPGSTVDGLHLSAAGHARLAELVAGRLR